jgi:hypothetical protein
MATLCSPLFALECEAGLDSLKSTLARLDLLGVHHSFKTQSLIQSCSVKCHRCRLATAINLVCDAVIPVAKIISEILQ